MPQVSSYATDTLDDTDKILGSTSGGLVKNYAGSQFGKLSVENQVLAGGATVTAKDITAGSPITIDCGDRPLQYLTNSGALTINAPAADGSCMLFIENLTGAGTITFSGFNVPASTGDALDTNPGNTFTVSIWRINGVSGYRIAAHQ